MMKRFYLSLAAVGATAALLTAGSFALFTANTTNVNNTFTAGTVTLGAPTNTLVNIATIAPGDSGTAGTFAVSYTGNLSAWLGVSATKNAGALFIGATPLTVTVSDGVTNHAADGAYHVVGTAPVAGGATTTLSVNYALPLNADNTYQGATGSVTLSVKAVQSKNNTLAAPAVGPSSWN